MENYFETTAAELIKPYGKLQIHVLGDSGAVFYQMALDMVHIIQKNNAKGAPTVLIIPVGPVGQYPFFIRLVQELQLSLKNCYFLNMDEYLDDNQHYIDTTNRLSFRGFMEREVYAQIPHALTIPEEQRFFPDPADPQKIQRVIDEIGGVDMAFGGIGINGHLPFNEAEENVESAVFKNRETRVIEISRETRVANAIGDLHGAIDCMPRYAITIGLKQILQARSIRIGVFRDWHRAVIRQTAFGPVSSHFPSTFLREHDDSIIYVNNVASQRPF